MPTLTLQHEFRALEKLPFCYFCGKQFLDGEDTTRDHLPPKACFAKRDRSHPLILPAHKACNTAENLTDERIGQLISLIHGRIPSAKNRRLKIAKIRVPDPTKRLFAVINVDLKGIIRRWIRGFHAALYKEPLSEEAQLAIEPPLQSGQIRGICIIPDPIRPQEHLWSEIISANKQKSNLDEIVCNNGKLNYHCVWQQANDNRWMCVFALDIYGWKILGEQKHLPTRDCVGMYFCGETEPPLEATRSLWEPLVS